MAEISLNKFRTADATQREHLFKKASINLAGARSDLSAILLNPEQASHAEHFRNRLENAEKMRQFAELQLKAQYLLSQPAAIDQANQEEFAESLWALSGYPLHNERTIHERLDTAHILFVDAVNSKWTRFMKKSLHPHQALLIDDDLTELKEDGMVGEALRYSNVCVMALDSAGWRKKLPNAVKKLFETWSGSGNMFVLDHGFHAGLRNYLLKHRSVYYGKAATIEPEAIRETVGVHVSLATVSGPKVFSVGRQDCSEGDRRVYRLGLAKPVSSERA